MGQRGTPSSTGRGWIPFSCVSAKPLFRHRPPDDRRERPRRGSPGHPAGIRTEYMSLLQQPLYSKRVRTWVVRARRQACPPTRVFPHRFGTLLHPPSDPSPAGPFPGGFLFFRPHLNPPPRNFGVRWLSSDGFEGRIAPRPRFFGLSLAKDIRRTAPSDNRIHEGAGAVTRVPHGRSQRRFSPSGETGGASRACR